MNSFHLVHVEEIVSNDIVATVVFEILVYSNRWTESNATS